VRTRRSLAWRIGLLLGVVVIAVLLLIGIVVNRVVINSYETVLTGQQQQRLDDAADTLADRLSRPVGLARAQALVMRLATSLGGEVRVIGTDGTTLAAFGRAPTGEGSRYTAPVSLNGQIVATLEADLPARAGDPGFLPLFNVTLAVAGVVSVLVIVIASASIAGRLTRPLHDVAAVVAEHVGQMPYPALNSAFDGLVPAGLQHYWKANFVDELTDAAIDAHLAHGPKVPAVNSTVHIYPINGAAHRVAADATAFAYRDANFATVIAGMWPEPAQNEANIKWVRDYYDATAPLSESGGYINFMAEDDQDRIKANYKGNYDRLVEVKRAYDPDNLFHLNQNIRP
jgi:FAD/FMN-containing dehydrogenase